MKEKWKYIEGYDMLYKISSKGRVYSAISERILKPILSKGYVKANLHLYGKSKIWAVHRLVMLHFGPKVNSKMAVNHIDGNKENNCISNLEWVTSKREYTTCFK